MLVSFTSMPSIYFGLMDGYFPDEDRLVCYLVDYEPAMRIHGTFADCLIRGNFRAFASDLNYATNVICA
jgi:hypothetical protein